MNGDERQRVVHVSTMHRPLDNRIFVKECRTLARNGYDVSFVVPHNGNEEVDGVKLLATTEYASGTRKLTSSALDVLRVVRGLSRDTIIHFHDPELLPIAFWTKLTGYTVVYDAHEDTPRQVFHLHWIPLLLKPLLSVFAYCMEKLAAWTFDGIVVANAISLARYPQRKTVLVQNYPIVDELVTALGIDHSERAPNVAYVGSITESRGIRQLLEALVLVNLVRPARLLLGGSFHPADLEIDLSADPGWKYVDFEGWLSRQEVKEVLERCRVGIATLLPEKQYVRCLPTKLFEYAAAGLPVVASDFHIIRAFVEDAACGVVVDPTRPVEIARAIRELLDDPAYAQRIGELGREAVQEKYNWATEAASLLNLYGRLTKARFAVGFDHG